MMKGGKYGTISVNYWRHFKGIYFGVGGLGTRSGFNE